MSTVMAWDRPAAEAGRGLRLSYAWLLVVIPFLALVLNEVRIGTEGVGDDYAQYLMHATALAEGRPYTDIGYIYTNLNHWLGPAAAPPGLPLLLAPVIALIGANMVVIRALMMGIAVAFLLMAGRYFGRREGVLMGLGVALLCGLSPALVQNASAVLTDLPFAALVWVLITLIDDGQPWRARKIVLITLLGGFTVLLRPVGVALAPALLLYTATHYREHRFAPALPVLVWGAGLLLAALFVDIQRASVVALSPSRIIAWLEMTHWGWRNLSFYKLSVFYSHLYPFPWNPANDVYHLVSIPLMVLGLASWLRRGWRSFLVAFAVAYGALLLIIPAHQHRYLWPLFPLLIFGLLEGIRIVTRLLQGAHTTVKPGVVALLVAVGIGVLHAAQVPSRVDHRSTLARRDVENLYRAVRTMAERAPMRVTYAKPRALAWETGVPAMGPFTAPLPATIAELKRKGITHLIVGLHSTEGMASVIAAAPQLFELEFRDSNYRIYRFLGACQCAEGVNADEDCCRS